MLKSGLSENNVSICIVKKIAILTIRTVLTKESSLFVNVSPEKIRICCGIFSSVSLTKYQTMARVVLVLNNVFRHSSFCFLMIFSDINFLEDFQINYLDQYSYLKEFFLNFRILT